MNAADVLTKDNIKEPIKDIRRALLEADVCVDTYKELLKCCTFILDEFITLLPPTSLNFFCHACSFCICLK
jgi:hypothetical protein